MISQKSVSQLQFRHQLNVKATTTFISLNQFIIKFPKEQNERSTFLLRYITSANDRCKCIEIKINAREKKKNSVISFTANQQPSLLLPHSISIIIICNLSFVQIKYPQILPILLFYLRAVFFSIPVIFLFIFLFFYCTINYNKM